LNAIAQTAAGDPTWTQPAAVEEGAETTQPASHIANTAWGGKMLKSLIAGGRFDPKTKTVVPVEPALNFADILYPNIKEYVIEWATGSSSFAVLALVESNNFSKKDEVLSLLKKSKKKLTKAATEETPEQKARREKTAAEQEAKDVKGGKGKKSKVVKEREVGNKGAALLLEKL
jgi:pumilio family protein 6